MTGHRQKILAPVFTTRTHKAPHPVGHRKWLSGDALRARALMLRTEPEVSALRVSIAIAEERE